MPDHLYTHGGKRRNLPKFERRYGPQKGKRVFGAVVGKVRRERMARGLCSLGGCGAPARHHHGRHGCCGDYGHHAEITNAHMMGGERGASSMMMNGPSILAREHGLMKINGPSILSEGPHVKAGLHVKGFIHENGPSIIENHVGDLLGARDFDLKRRHEWGL